MRKKTTLIFIFLILSGFVFSQDKKSEKDNKNKSTENTARIFINADCEREQSIRFRLFNNTNWAIAVSTFSFYLTPNNIRRIKFQNEKTIYLMPNDKEITSLFYYTEREKSQGKEKSLVLGGYKTDSYNTSWIGSKDSIVFSIPKKELENNTEVYIPFKYEWELNERGLFSPNEAEHRAYFRFPDNNNPQKLSVCSVEVV